MKPFWLLTYALSGAAGWWAGFLAVTSAIGWVFFQETVPAWVPLVGVGAFAFMLVAHGVSEQVLLVQYQNSAPAADDQPALPQDGLLRVVVVPLTDLPDLPAKRAFGDYDLFIQVADGRAQKVFLRKKRRAQAA